MCCNVIPRRLMFAIAAAGLLVGLGRFVADTAYAAEDGADEPEPAVPGVLDFTMKSIEGEDVDLSRYYGDVVMIVNTASKCGRTPQYKQLQELHEAYSEQGLSILGFPANNFGKQEPGSNDEIATFCEQNYGVTFDMFAKISVKGDDIAPLYKYLTDKETNPDFGGDIKWNFDKFLVSREGEVVARFKSGMKPDHKDVLDAIKAHLAKPRPAAAGSDEGESAE